jgi:hypothetical protein
VVQRRTLRPCPGLAPAGLPVFLSESAPEIEFFRDESGCHHCGRPAECWGEALRRIPRGDFPAARSFALVFAVTWRLNAVRAFYTRNDRDFRGFGFFDVVNPEFDPLRPLPRTPNQGSLARISSSLRAAPVIFGFSAKARSSARADSAVSPLA